MNWLGKLPTEVGCLVCATLGVVGAVTPWETILPWL